MTATPTPPVPTSGSEAAPLSQGARILNTFIAPSKTFTDLRRSASWWAPWLLIAVFSLLFVFIVGQQVGYDQVTRNAITSSPRVEQFEKLPADQQARQLQFATTLTRVLAYASPVFVLVAFLVIAAVLLGTFNLGFGAGVSFKVAFAIVAYSSLPGIIHAVLGTISVVAGGLSGSLDKKLSISRIQWRRIPLTSCLRLATAFSTELPRLWTSLCSGRSC